MNLTNYPLFPLITTKEESQQFIQELSALNDVLYTKTSTFSQKMDTVFSQEKITFLQTIMNTEHIQEGNISHIETFLSELQIYLKSLPVVDITLAIVPTKALINDIAEKIASQFKNPFLLDIKTNPELICGAAIAFDGTFKNYSFQTLVENAAQSQS